MNIKPVTDSAYKTQTAEYTALKPLIAAMHSNNDKLPDNSLPVNTQGTIQENADKAAKVNVVTYNAHGILKSENPNSLLGYA